MYPQELSEVPVISVAAGLYAKRGTVRLTSKVGVCEVVELDGDDARSKREVLTSKARILHCQQSSFARDGDYN